MGIVQEFERSVGQALAACGYDRARDGLLGVAVSGGADSIALLTALCHLYGTGVHALTVDHNLRSPQESGGDARFVQDYCARLGVPCTRHDVPAGHVRALARERGLGIEEAARTVRYRAFDAFIAGTGVSALCLAHTKGDQLETLLMRFLSGGDAKALSGIPAVRGPYVRPLLGQTRARIEAYLAAQGIPFRTDSTNADDSLLRNRIRHRIIPLLDGQVPGWQGALDALAHKMRADEEALAACTEQALPAVDWQQEGSGADAVVSCAAAAFCAQSRAVRRRLVYRAVGAVGADARVPYAFVERVLSHGAGAAWHESACGIAFRCEDGRIFAQKVRKVATESGFSVIMERCGTYAVASLSVEVSAQDGGVTLRALQKKSEKGVITIPQLGFPFVFRSRQPADSIQAADGSLRPVSKILEDWKCGSRKDAVPLIQELADPAQRLVCVWGSLFGYRDWLVRRHPAGTPGAEAPVP